MDGADGRPRSAWEADSECCIRLSTFPLDRVGTEWDSKEPRGRSHGDRFNPPAHIAKITHLTRAKASTWGHPGCLVGYVCPTKPLPRYLELPVVPVQLCSETGNNKLLTNMVSVTKRLRDIIPKYMRNHSQITRPA